MKILFLLLFAATLCGCNLIHVIADKPAPFAVHCDGKCFAACDEKSLPVTSNPDSAGTALLVEHAYRQACDNRREACAQCVQRGIDAGAIK